MVERALRNPVLVGLHVMVERGFDRHHMQRIVLLQQGGDQQQGGGVDRVRGRLQRGAAEHQLPAVAQRAARRRQDPGLRGQIAPLQIGRPHHRMADAGDGAGRLHRQLLALLVAICTPMRNSGASSLTREIARGSKPIAGVMSDAHIDLADRPVFQRDDVLVRQRQAGQRRARVTDHRFTEQGRFQAARQALEQLDLQHVLEAFQLLGGSRLRHAQRLRSPMDIAMVVQCEQQQQLPGFQASTQKPVCAEGGRVSIFVALRPVPPRWRGWSRDRRRALPAAPSSPAAHPVGRGCAGRSGSPCGGAARAHAYWAAGCSG